MKMFQSTLVIANERTGGWGVLRGAFTRFNPRSSLLTSEPGRRHCHSGLPKSFNPRSSLLTSEPPERLANPV